VPVTTPETLSVKEAIETRRSIREYVQEPIPKEDIDEILRLTSLAPSGSNIQPWRFIVVTDPELKAQLKAVSYNQRQVGGAPALIIVTSDMEDVLLHLDETVHPAMSQERKEQGVKGLQHTFGSMSVEERGRSGLTQANIAFGFLLVAATGLGYATSPMLGFEQDKVRQLLGLGEHVQFAGMVALGKAAEEGFPTHRHPLERIVTYH
jgi:nitroreductase